MRSFLILGHLMLAVSAWPNPQKSSPKWVPLPVSKPKQIATAISTGPKAITDVLHISVAMPYRDAVGMQAFVDSVSKPSSPNYRHFLKPNEVGNRFGLTNKQVQQVADYLESQGIKVKLIAKNHLNILAEATVAQVQTAFHTAIDEFSVPDQNQLSRVTRFSFTTPPCVPDSIQPFVSYIGGLENFTQPKARASLVPSQFRTLYNVAPLYANAMQGQGRTIAISNFDGYRLSNVGLEYSYFNLPSPSGGVGSNIKVVPINGKDGNTSYASLEGDLDIQTVLAMAPQCNLIVYDDAQDTDLLAVLSQEADDNFADIVTESYGWSGDSSFYAAAHNIHLAFSAQGTTYVAASGDSGTSISTSPYADIDPEVLVVGGTTVDTDSSGNRISEIGWTGSGGGWAPSTDPFNVLPAYQKGTGVPTTIPFRLIPDVALDANPFTGYEIFVAGVLHLQVGGTSCATPTFAASLADCEQQIITDGGLPPDAVGNRRFGRIQDLLYSFNGDATVFFDVTSGSNGSLPNGVPSQAAIGWDTVTGWGAMNFSGFVTRVLNSAAPLKILISPTAVVGGTSAVGTVLLTSLAGSNGLSVQLASSNPVATVPVTLSIPAGQLSATFQISTTGSATANAVISASANQITITAPLVINQPNPLAKVTASPSGVTGGATAVGTVTLTGPAPPYGLTVTLSSDNSATVVPSSVTVGATMTSASFPISTSVVSAATTANILARQGGFSVSTAFGVNPATLNKFSFLPVEVTGGMSATGTVTLTGAAPPGGIVVSITSTPWNQYAYPIAALPPSVTVPAGETSVNFPVSTFPVSSDTGLIVTAQAAASYGTYFWVSAATLAQVTVTPSTLVGGNTVTGTVSLNSAAGPGGMSVALSSNLKGLTLPASVLVPSGSLSANFSLTPPTVKSSTSAKITAGLNTVSQSTSVTIEPTDLSSISISPASVQGGTKAVGAVSLSGPAPIDGTTVSLASSNPNVVVPVSAKVAAGATTASFTVTTKGVLVPVTASITGRLGKTAKSTNLSLLPTVLQAIVIQPSEVTGGTGSATGTVTLSGPAPLTGALVKLSSSNAKVGVVPPSVMVPGGKTSASFKITTKQVSVTTAITISGVLEAITKQAELTVNTKN